MSQVKKDDTVKVHYTGKLKDGEVFDSSSGREPLEFTVGAGQMIPGFEKGIMDMKLNEKKTIEIPASEAYGEKREELLQEVKKVPQMKGMELASKVSTKEILDFPSTTGKTKYKVALIDFGSVRSIASYLNTLDCEVKVYPMSTPLDKMLADKPNGFVLSSGPGDPSTMASSVQLVKDIIATNIPVMGINIVQNMNEVAAVITS